MKIDADLKILFNFAKCIAYMAGNKSQILKKKITKMSNQKEKLIEFRLIKVESLKECILLQ